MNKQMKAQLEAVVNAIVSEDTDAAKEAFHDYLRAKTQSILLGEAEDCADDDMDDDKEDKKSDKKDDKKPPFAKKDDDKKSDKKDDDKEDKKDE